MIRRVNLQDLPARCWADGASHKPPVRSNTSGVLRAIRGCYAYGSIT
jgi:hypothetical protein